jgi:DNA-binding transcriptional MerR regulator
MEKALPAIPAKRYFTIGEVSDLCGVKPYVLRYWEQEFTQLKPMKRRGNRRYYQHHEVLLIRRIRELLYDQGFTISGARNRLADGALSVRVAAPVLEDDEIEDNGSIIESAAAMLLMHPAADRFDVPVSTPSVALAPMAGVDTSQLRAELLSIRDLLSV